MAESIQMKPEVFFLKYAFPCAFIAQQRNEINEEDMKELEHAAIKEISLPKEKLEKIFFRAFQRIEPIAKELNKDKWDLEVLKEYFLKKHSIMVENGLELAKDIPRTLKELCKVHKAKIIDKKDNLLIVQYNNQTRTVISSLIPNAKIGDIVTIHYGYAIEIVS